MPELSDFDIDLSKGKAGEDTVAHLLTIETVEVKTDFKWKNTGNVYVETHCWYNSSKEWKPSGLNVSKATHWAFNLEGTVLIVEREQLIEAVLHYGRPINCNIEPNPSQGYLITPEQIIQYVREASVYTK